MHEFNGIEDDGDSKLAASTLQKILTDANLTVDYFAQNIDSLNLAEGQKRGHVLGAKTTRKRLITEITIENILQCRKLATEFEINHLAGIGGSFMIVGRQRYYSLRSLYTHSSNVALFHSDDELFVSQQLSLFEVLWDKSMPFDQRVREIEEGVPSEAFEVVRGIENIVRNQVDGLISTKTQLDACCDHTFPATLISNEPVWNMCLDMQRKGVRVRTITEITPENLEYCEKMTTRLELRHLDSIHGNFSVSDKKIYRGAASMKEGEPPVQGIRSTANTFVEQQQYFFETLWNKAIPAKQRIMQIKEGIVPETIETLSDYLQTQKFAVELVGRAKKELLIMFASANEYRRQKDDSNGFLKVLTQLPAEVRSSLSIRIALPAQSSAEVPSDHEESPNINLNSSSEKNGPGSIKGKNDKYQTGLGATFCYFESTLSTMVTILIIDRKYALVLELRNDGENQISAQSTGLAIYSNINALVLSYVSIFELLWTHMELYEELRVREEAQKEFATIAAHELRAPIQPILGLAEEIRFRQSRGSEGKLLGIILSSAMNLQRLADNLLDVARIQNNSLKLNLTRFDLNELIASVVADYALDAARKQSVEMRFSSSVKQIIVEADADRLRQVLSNCLQNSLRFTESGTIHVISGNRGIFAEVVIKDTGIGIDALILPKLFTKFVTSSSMSGTGLGLFISKKIVEAHGGKIIGINNVGEQGATIEFRIPLHTI